MVNLNSVEGIESLIEKRTKPLKKQVKELTNLVNELKEAINYTRCCEELKNDIKFERKSSARVFNNEKGIWEFI